MQEKYKHNSKSAFTLIELAIVIVVIGILIIGVVGGQSIIQSSKRQAIISDINKIKTAVNAFRLEFDGLPGDFNEAEDYWPGETRNGNNDKKISDSHIPTEAYLFWDHLNLSGIYPSAVVNEYHNQYDPADASKTYPKSPIDGAFYVLSDRFFGHAGYGNSPFRRSTNIAIARPDPENDHFAGIYRNTSVTPNFAYSIDKKIDDGKAINGKIGAAGQVGNSIAAASNDCHDMSQGLYNLSMSYNLENNDNSCALIFILHDKNGKFQ